MKRFAILLAFLLVSPAAAFAEEFGLVDVSIYDTNELVEVGAETIYVIDLLNERLKPVSGLRISYELTEEFAIIGWAEGDEGSFKAAPIETVPELAPAGHYRIRVKAKAVIIGSGSAKFRVTVRHASGGEPIIAEERTFIYSVPVL